MYSQNWHRINTSSKLHLRIFIITFFSQSQCYKAQHWNKWKFVLFYSKKKSFYHCQNNVYFFCLNFCPKQHVKNSHFHLWSISHFTSAFAPIFLLKQVQTLYVSRKKLHLKLLNKKAACKMLVKLTPVILIVFKDVSSILY
jgi:hypothetical protein